MNEDHLNMQIRKFLKKVGIQSQREIENAVQAAVSDGRMAVGQSVPASVKLTMPDIGLEVSIDGEISVE